MKKLLTPLLAVCVVFMLVSGKPDKKKYYGEKYRPQYHFTPEKNWHNDPNGLVYYDGEYHLFYQHNPKGNEWGFMHWGHAVSEDLLHWKHLPIAIYPDEGSEDKVKCTAFSGSAIVDEHNLLGVQEGGVKTLVAFYTSQHCGQRIAYSTDKGRNWVKYEGNPIIPLDDKDDARDPKVIWHDQSQKWVMALYRKDKGTDNSKGVSFYSSDNLVDWTWTSHIVGFYECPDLVQLKVKNRPEERKWILFDGDGSYLIGDFNGKEFIPETPKLKGDYGKNYYATQCWSNLPDSDDRSIQIAWMRGGEFPDMPFNGQMTFPGELQLWKNTTGYTLKRKPIGEIESLHGKHYKWEDKVVIPGINNNNLLKKVKGNCLHIKGEFDMKTADTFGFFLRKGKKESGTEIMFDVRRGVLSVLGTAVPFKARNNKIKVDILLDKSSIEIYVEDGQYVVSNCFVPTEGAEGIELFTHGGELGVEKLNIYKMDSVWSEEE